MEFPGKNMEWISIYFSGGTSWLRIEPTSPCVSSIACRFFISRPPGNANTLQVGRLGQLFKDSGGGGVSECRDLQESRLDQSMSGGPCVKAQLGISTISPPARGTGPCWDSNLGHCSMIWWGNESKVPRVLAWRMPGLSRSWKMKDQGPGTVYVSRRREVAEAEITTVALGSLKSCSCLPLRCVSTHDHEKLSLNHTKMQDPWPP